LRSVALLAPPIAYLLPLAAITIDIIDLVIVLCPWFYLSQYSARRVVIFYSPGLTYSINTTSKKA